jgi:hypothetical protein
MTLPIIRLKESLTISLIYGAAYIQEVRYTFHMCASLSFFDNNFAIYIVTDIVLPKNIYLFILLG